MAGMEGFLLTGGSPMPAVSTSPAGISTGGLLAQPHTGAVMLVLAAVLVLVALDKLGFRFAVTAGRG